MVENDKFQKLIDKIKAQNIDIYNEKRSEEGTEYFKISRIQNIIDKFNNADKNRNISPLEIKSISFHPIAPVLFGEVAEITKSDLELVEAKEAAFIILSFNFNFSPQYTIENRVEYTQNYVNDFLKYFKDEYDKSYEEKLSLKPLYPSMSDSKQVEAMFKYVYTNYNAICTYNFNLITLVKF